MEFQVEQQKCKS